MLKLKKCTFLGVMFAFCTSSLAAVAAPVTVTKNSGPTTPHLADFPPSYVGHPNKVGYGSGEDNAMFLETFQIRCPSPSRLNSATLQVVVTKLTQGEGQGDNDAIGIWASPTQHFQASMWVPSTSAGALRVQSYPLHSLMPVGTGPDTITALPSPFAGGNMLAAIQQSQRVSFSVQDDTRVHAATLTYECQAGRTVGEVININPGHINTITPINTNSGCPSCTEGTCCPPLTGLQIRDFFTQTAHSYSTGYNMVVNVSSTAYLNLINGYTAYLGLLKFMCPTVDHLVVRFTPHTAASIGGALTSNLTTPFNLQIGTGGVSAPGAFGFTFQPNVIYGISAETVAVDARGRKVDCGFTGSCNQGDRFTFAWQIGARLAPGTSSTPQSPMQTGN
jgi:hypothetical protein